MWGDLPGASTLKLIESTVGLQPRTARDANAKDLGQGHLPFWLLASQKIGHHCIKAGSDLHVGGPVATPSTTASPPGLARRLNRIADAPPVAHCIHARRRSLHLPAARGTVTDPISGQRGHRR